MGFDATTVENSSTPSAEGQECRGQPALHPERRGRLAAGPDDVIEGTASLVTDQDTREAAATAFEEAYGWQLTRDDGTWYRLGGRGSYRERAALPRPAGQGVRLHHQ